MSVKGKPFVGKVTEETRKKMSLARLGKKASEETRAKLRIIRSQPRGSYMQRWENITRLCSLRGWNFTRTRNYWKIIDNLKVVHSFPNAKDAITFLQGDIDYESIIEELCKGTSYRVEKGWREYVIYHGRIKLGTMKTPESVVQILRDFRSR